MPERTCVDPSCDMPATRRGRCMPHYQRLRRADAFSDLRPFVEPKRKRLPEGPTRTKRCPTCDQDFSYTVTRGTDRLYCTPACRKARAVAAAKSALLARPSCVVDGCSKPVRSAHAQACETHYYRLRRTGTYERRPYVITSPRECQVCGAAIPKQRKYCSGACVAAGRTGRALPGTRTEPIEHTCDVCGSIIVSTNNHWRRYCSEPCRSLNGRLRRYGIEVSEFNELLSSQSGCCAVCSAADERLVVDHDHATGRVRGLLCGGCNVGIGYLGDSPARMLLAAQYVERHALPEVADGLGELQPEKHLAAQLAAPAQPHFEAGRATVPDPRAQVHRHGNGGRPRRRRPSGPARSQAGGAPLLLFSVPSGPQ